MGQLKTFYREYETDTTDVAVRERPFKILVPKTIDRFINPDNFMKGFPLWAKVWQASMILADYMAGLEPDPDKTFLEIGAGLGLVGIVAASFGHRVTMTEYNKDALKFAKANKELNMTDNKANLEIRKLDWTRPKLKGSFDYIIGSEVAYKEGNASHLLDLFRKYLKPEGEIILAEGVRKTSVDFFRQMSEHFDMKAQKKVLRSKDEETRAIFCTMSWKASR